MGLTLSCRAVQAFPISKSELPFFDTELVSLTAPCHWHGAVLTTAFYWFA